MQKKQRAQLTGLRLIVWGAILFLMMMAAALIMDMRAPAPSYRDAVLVSAAGDAA